MYKFNIYQRRVLIVVTVTAMTVFCAIPFLIYHCVSSALDSENTWVSECSVLDLATAYLEDNPEWPKSWEDLERARVPSNWHWDSIPVESFADWKEDVNIDFSLTRADVAAMTVENFTAIRPVRSCWPPDVRKLLWVARQDDGCVVLEVLSIYLRNHAEWPRSWTDLKETRLPLEGGGFYFAADFLEQWKSRVFVDFNTTRAQVADMTVQNFSAVKPIRPVYGPREQRIREVLKVARQQPGEEKPADPKRGD